MATLTRKNKGPKVVKLRYQQGASLKFEGIKNFAVLHFGMPNSMSQNRANLHKFVHACSIIALLIAGGSSLGFTIPTIYEMVVGLPYFLDYFFTAVGVLTLSYLIEISSGITTPYALRSIANTFINAGGTEVPEPDAPWLERFWYKFKAFWTGLFRLFFTASGIITICVVVISFGQNLTSAAFSYWGGDYLNSKMALQTRKEGEGDSLYQKNAAFNREVAAIRKEYAADIAAAQAQDDALLARCKEAGKAAASKMKAKMTLEESKSPWGKKEIAKAYSADSLQKALEYTPKAPPIIAQRDAQIDVLEQTFLESRTLDKQDRSAADELFNKRKKAFALILTWIFSASSLLYVILILLKTLLSVNQRFMDEDNVAYQSSTTINTTVNTPPSGVITPITTPITPSSGVSQDIQDLVRRYNDYASKLRQAINAPSPMRKKSTCAKNILDVYKEYMDVVADELENNGTDEQVAVQDAQIALNKRIAGGWFPIAELKQYAANINE